MSRRTLALLLAVLVLALGVAWIATRGASGTVPLADPIEQALARTASSPPGAVIAPPAPAIADVPVAAARTSAPTPVSVSDVPVDAPWVEGRVEFPPGTPQGERAYVSVVVPAINHNFRDSQPVRFPVGDDGRFRFPVPERAWTLELDVVGRCLHTPRPRALKVDALPPDIVLRPSVGACLRVGIAPSPQLLARGFDPARASVGRRSKPVDLSTQILDPLRTETTDATGTAYVEGLDVERSWTVTVWANGALPAEREVPALRPGELRDVVVPLDAAPRFSGFVRDEHGVPIERATVVLSIATKNGEMPTHGVSLADGSFEIHGFAPGVARLRVTCSGYAERELGPWHAGIGADVAGIDIVLAGGAEISGVVGGPDDGAVDGAWIFVERGAPSDAAQRERVAVGADGAFRVQGVAGEAMTLHARGRARSDPNDLKSPYILWTARADVRAPVNDVVLVLSRGSSLRGRVMDDLGIAIAGAQVLASLVVRENEDGYRTPVETDADGVFVLDLLRDGAWRISANAPGTYCDGVVVEMPGDATRSVEVVVTRGGVIEGRVVDARGDPVGDAHVVVETVDRTPAKPRSLPTATSSADGWFQIERSPGGMLRASAWKHGHARSLPVVVEVAQAETTSGVVLALRVGGTIDVRVLDAGGLAVADEELGLRRAGVEVLVGNARTDASGRARFEGVDEGLVTVGPPSLRGRSTYKHAAVEVVSGAASSVVLRP